LDFIASKGVRLVSIGAEGTKTRKPGSVWNLNARKYNVLKKLHYLSSNTFTLWLPPLKWSLHSSLCDSGTYLYAWSTSAYFVHLIKSILSGIVWHSDRFMELDERFRS
jgi:hypothetical protein